MTRRIRVSDTYTVADVRATYPDRAAWVTVVFVDPLAGRLVLWIANRTLITPNQLTLLGAVLGLGAAGAYLEGSRLSMIIGAALFYLSYVIDCVDGKLARLTGAVSLFGAWLDYVLDRVKIAICTLGLMTGQVLRTDRTIYLFLAFAVLFGEMFRQLHASHIREMQAMAVAASRSGSTQSIVSADPAESGGGGLSLGRPRRSLSMPPDSRRMGGIYDRLRAAALAHRVRPHLWSGIEFEMFVFVVAPITGAIIQVTAGSTILLLAFEAAVVYRQWHSSKILDRSPSLLITSSASPDRPRKPTAQSQ